MIAIAELGEDAMAYAYPEDVYDAATITEADIDWLAEIAEADEEAEHEWEYRREVADCCGGRDWTCGHYGHGAA